MSSLSSMGDLAQDYRTRIHSHSVTSELSRLSTELSTGRNSDLGRATRGDFTLVATIERGLRLAEIHANALAEADIATTAQQNTLELMQEKLSQLAPTLLSATASGQVSRLAGAAADAEQTMQQIISAMNTKVAGRSLFSADQTDRPALIDARDMLDQLETLTAAATDGAQIVAIVNDWFMGAGGGYETNAYLGGSGHPPQFVTAEGQVLSSEITAKDPALRAGLASLALAALAARGLGPLSESAQAVLINNSASGMLAAQDKLSQLRADLGGTQARIEETRSLQEALTAGLRLEQTRILGIDPYETATELQAVQAQLETLFLITARLSRMSLAEYLR